MTTTKVAKALPQKLESNSRNHASVRGPYTKCARPKYPTGIDKLQKNAESKPRKHRKVERPAQRSLWREGSKSTTSNANNWQRESATFRETHTRVSLSPSGPIRRSGTISKNDQVCRGTPTMTKNESRQHKVQPGYSLFGVILAFRFLQVVATGASSWEVMRGSSQAMTATKGIHELFT